MLLRRLERLSIVVTAVLVAAVLSAPVEAGGIVGACCLGSGDCIEVTAGECDKGGGLYQGDGSTCDGVECPPPGACCLQPNLDCLNVTAFTCDALDGTFVGEGTVCKSISDPICDFLLGACCFGDGTCDDFLTEGLCAEVGSYFLGPGTSCTETACEGACCFGEGSCVNGFEVDCEKNGGFFAGPGTSCETGGCTGACIIGFPGCLTGNCVETTAFECDKFLGGTWQGLGAACPAPCDGACCFPGKSCSLLTEDDCASFEGVYLGDGTDCGDEPCVDPVGACCLTFSLGGACIEVSEFECQSGENFYQGDGTICATGQCAIPQPGACCFSLLAGPAGAGGAAVGECAELFEFDCLKSGGSFQGEGVTCASGACDPPGLGACCLPDEQCADDLTQAFCLEMGGAYQGDDTFCADVLCGPIEPCCDFEEPSEFEAVAEATREDTGNFDLDFPNAFEDVVAIIPEPGADGVAGSVQVFLNFGLDSEGAIVLVPQTPALPVGVDPSDVSVGNLDGQNGPDFAVSNEGDSTVTIYLNAPSADGTFLAPITLTADDLPGMIEPSAILVEDFLGSDLDDLVIASAGNETLLLFENLGGAFASGLGFGGVQGVAVGGRISSLEPEDLDNDKDMDVVGSNGNDSATVVRQGGGAASGGDFFLPAVNLAVGADPVDIDTADIDGDGLPDIVTANRGGGSVSIILNDGNGMFDLSTPDVPVGMEPRSVDTGDFDGDGDPDIAVAVDAPPGAAAGGIPAVRVFGNGSTEDNPVFAPGQTFGVDADPNFLVAVDMDNDGTPDIVTANQDPDGPTGGSITVLLQSPNTCPADVDGDDFVGLPDLLAVLAAFGVCLPDDPCVEDLDEDGAVGFTDVLIVLTTFGPCPADDGTCPADLNGDGTVDGDDLTILIESLGDCPMVGPCPADLTGDGIVDTADFVALLAAWGDCP